MSKIMEEAELNTHCMDFKSKPKTSSQIAHAYIIARSIITRYRKNSKEEVLLQKWMKYLLKWKDSISKYVRSIAEVESDEPSVNDNPSSIYNNTKPTENIDKAVGSNKIIKKDEQ